MTSAACPGDQYLAAGVKPVRNLIKIKFTHDVKEKHLMDKFYGVLVMTLLEML